MSVSDKLITAAQNELKVYKSGQLDILKNSKYMNTTMSGSAISVNDVSSIEHKLKVKLTSKNLFDINKVTKFNNYNVNQNIVNITDGIYTCNMGGYGNSVYMLYNIPTIYGSTYTISADCRVDVTDGNDDSKNHDVSLGVVADINGVTKTYASTKYLSAPYNEWQRTSHTFTLDPDAKIIGVRIQGTGTSSNYQSLKRQAKNIQIEISSTATDYTPYIDDFSSVNISRYGKNLFNITNFQQAANNAANTAYKIRVNNNTLSFAAKKATRGGTAIVFPAKAGEVFSFSFDKVSGGNYDVVVNAFKDINKSGYTSGYKTLLQKQNATTCTVTMIADYSYITFELYNHGNYWNVVVENLQVENNPSSTEYEPYIEPQTVTANSDGTVEGLTSLSPNMALMSDTDGVDLTANYYRDINKTVSNMLTEIALTGGGQQ